MEIHFDLGCLINWLPIEQGGPELPLFYCIEGSLTEHWLAAYKLRIVGFSILADSYLHHDGAAKATDARDGWIEWRHSFQHVHRFKVRLLCDLDPGRSR